MNHIKFCSNILTKPYTDKIGCFIPVYLSIIAKVNYNIAKIDEYSRPVHSAYYLNCQNFADVLGNIYLTNYKTE